MDTISWTEFVQAEFIRRELYQSGAFNWLDRDILTWEYLTKPSQIHVRTGTYVPDLLENY